MTPLASFFFMLQLLPAVGSRLDRTADGKLRAGYELAFYLFETLGLSSCSSYLTALALDKRIKRDHQQELASIFSSVIGAAEGTADGVVPWTGVLGLSRRLVQHSNSWSRVFPSVSGLLPLEEWLTHCYTLRLLLLALLLLLPQAALACLEALPAVHTMLSTLMEPQRGSTPASVRELQLLAKGTAGGRPSEASLLWFAFGSLAFVGGLTPTLSAGVPVRHKRGDITGVVLQRYPEEGTFSYVRLEGRQHGAEAADGPVGEGAWDWAASDDAGDAEGEIVTNAVAQDFNVGNVARIDFSTWSWNLAEAATQVEKLLQLIANINTRLLSAEKDYLSGENTFTLCR